MEVMLISECLLGVCCRYDGASKPLPKDVLGRLREKFILIPVCPEQLGGLATPREPSERVGERVLMRSGTDVTAQYERGASEALRLARLFGAKRALLKARSPSCGRDTIYDGTFSGALTARSGVTAGLFLRHGIEICTEEEIRDIFENSPQKKG